VISGVAPVIEVDARHKALASIAYPQHSILRRVEAGLVRGSYFFEALRRQDPGGPTRYIRFVRSAETDC
jgi:hypothetical protein